MTKKSSKSKSSSSFKRSNNRYFRFSWLFQFLFISLLCISAYVLWLDFRIHSEFEGKRWSLPARVYARPMEIYPGQKLTPVSLEKELLANGYQKSSRVSNTGQYRRLDSYIELKRRAFRYWDGLDSERYLRISIAGGIVHEIKELTTNQVLGLVRLEPQLIGKIYPDSNEDRALFPYSEIPQFLIDALIAVEDRYFFRHNGVDIRGVARALITNIRRGGIRQGGSTLTQQLVKNFFLSQERTFSRKFNEMIMALLLERRYSKAEILSAYINEVYLGQHGSRGIHGFGSAAEFYFGRPLNELRNDQLALLVGLVKGASYYNPRRHLQRAIDRRNLVLTLMEQQSFIDQPVAEKAQSQALDLAARPKWRSAKYPAFLELVKRQLLRDYRLEDLKSEGLRIFTTLSPSIQQTLERRSSQKLLELEKAKALVEGSLEAAVLITNVSTGEIVAISGGRNRDAMGFNRALDAKRPVGSLIKPFVYLTALAQPEKYNVLTRIRDEELSLELSNGELWQPRNYDREMHGPVTLLEALAKSYNLATVNLGIGLGVEQVIATIEKTGFTGRINPYPSLLLGAQEMSPMEVTQMYQILANGGFRVPLNAIREVLDSRDSILQRNMLQIEQVLASESVMLTNYLLTEVVERGTARGLQRTMADRLPLAGKTGTTNALRDSWFVGYGDDLLTTVWLGRDDNKPTSFTGTTGAMQVWANVMGSVEMQSLHLVPPPGVKRSDKLTTRFEKNCITLSAVPYISNAGHGLTDGCAYDTTDNNMPKKKSSLFDLFNWFQ